MKLIVLVLAGLFGAAKATNPNAGENGTLLLQEVGKVAALVWRTGERQTVPHELVAQCAERYGIPDGYAKPLDEKNDEELCVAACAFEAIGNWKDEYPDGFFLIVKTAVDDFLENFTDLDVEVTKLMTNISECYVRKTTEKCRAFREYIKCFGAASDALMLYALAKG